MLFTFIASGNVNAQWAWAKDATTPGANIFDIISASNATGDIYLSGVLNGSASFGTYTINDSNLFYHVFLAKYDSLGNVEWAKGSGCQANATPSSITTDIWGNIYLVGSFTGAYLRFDNAVLENEDSFGTGNAMFIAKFSASGSLVWAQTATRDWGYSDNAYAVSTDAEGNVYVSGDFNSSNMVFGSDTAFNANFTSSNSAVFVVKYDSTGNVLWAKGMCGSNDGSSHINSSTTDAAGYLYIAGNYTDSAMIFGATTLTNPNVHQTAVYLTKIDSSGNVVWAKGALSNDATAGNTLATDPWGHIYMGGQFSGSYIDFGHGAVTGGSMFLVKYDSTGNSLWSRTAGTSGANSVATDAQGDVFAIGSFGGSVMFGSHMLTDTSAGGCGDMFTVKYDSMGTADWASASGGNFPSGCFAVSPGSVCTHGQAVYVSGSTWNAYITFDGLTLLNTSDHSNCYLARLDDYAALGDNKLNTECNKINVFPNPNNGKMTVALDNANYTGIVIYDVTGRMVYNTKMANGVQSIQISIENYADGLYYLRATGGDGAMNVPFVIRH